jgi:hypothetical protein
MGWYLEWIVVGVLLNIGSNFEYSLVCIPEEGSKEWSE